MAGRDYRYQGLIESNMGTKVVIKERERGTGGTIMSFTRWDNARRGPVGTPVLP